MKYDETQTKVDLLAAARKTAGVYITQAARGADAVITDTWVSMGDTDRDTRMQALGPFQVDAALMALAKPDALFFHDMPAHRGEEVTAEVIDGLQSVIWDEAENRIHAQKAVLAWCFGAIG
jgi:ornithine carbamoyltransferase